MVAVLIHSLLAGSLCFLSTENAANAAPPVVLKIASGFPKGFRGYDTLDAAARAVTAKTEGRVRIEWVTGTTMGGDDLATLLKGELAAAVVPSATLGAHAPTAAAFSLPLAFESLEEAGFVSERLAPSIEQELARLQLEPLAFAGMGFAYLAARKPIETPDTLRGSRLWTPKQSTSDTFDFSATGAVGVPLLFDEVEKALAAPLTAENSVECVIGLPDFSILKGWHRHLTFVLDLPLFLVDFRFVARTEALKPISQADRDLFVGEFRTAFTKIDTDRRARAAAFRRVFERAGATVHVPSVEQRAKWIAWRDEMTKGFASDKKISDETLAALAAAREEFRAKK